MEYQFPIRVKEEAVTLELTLTEEQHKLLLAACSKLTYTNLSGNTPMDVEEVKTVLNFAKAVKESTYEN